MSVECYDYEEKQGHISGPLCLFFVLYSICVVPSFLWSLSPLVYFGWPLWLQLSNIILTEYQWSGVNQIAERRNELWACGGEASPLPSATSLQPSNTSVEVVGAPASTFIFKAVVAHCFSVYSMNKWGCMNESMPWEEVVVDSSQCPREGADSITNPQLHGCAQICYPRSFSFQCWSRVTTLRRQAFGTCVEGLF